MSYLTEKIIGRKSSENRWIRPAPEFSIDSASAEALANGLRLTAIPQGQIARSRIILSASAGKTTSRMADVAITGAKDVCKRRNRIHTAGFKFSSNDQNSGQA